ncbi:hypothetical protein HDF09_002639 [Edaphobacter lichenicola]|uniref:Uncharacterized protein n=1 Tax=Tunturiibacter empetritectus TaxID=3069691 RepID=A0A7W8MRS7_9BACT|nr:hypothetical protein [Edaphobacter lichenicola]
MTVRSLSLSACDGSIPSLFSNQVAAKPTSLHTSKNLRPDYDQSSVDAVTEWRFKTALENGKSLPANQHRDHLLYSAVKTRRGH